jgi:hypothetical protein
MRMRGNHPSWIAWRVIEKAPVTIDWLAMMVAMVATPTNGISSASGYRRKKMLSVVGAPASTIADCPA